MGLVGRVRQVGRVGQARQVGRVRRVGQVGRVEGELEEGMPTASLRRAAMIVTFMASATAVFAQPGSAMPGLTLQPQKRVPRPFVFSIPTPTPAGKAPETAKPALVCGMLVIPADPKFDAAIRKDPSKPGTTFTLKSVQPTLCTRDQRR